MADGTLFKTGDFPPLVAAEQIIPQKNEAPLSKPTAPLKNKIAQQHPDRTQPKTQDNKASSSNSLNPVLPTFGTRPFTPFVPQPKHTSPATDPSRSNTVGQHLQAPPQSISPTNSGKQVIQPAPLAEHESKVAQTYLGSYPLKPRYVRDGLPCVSFNLEDKDTLVSKIKFVVIAKFSHGRPRFKDFMDYLQSLDFSSEFNVSVFDFKHIYIEFRMFEDFAKLWMRKAFSIKGFGVRLFRWVDNFNPAIESSFAPIWIHFPGLPLYLIEEESILSLAAAIGSPLTLDQRNLSHEKTAYVSVCVALDITIKHPEAIWVEFKGKGDNRECFMQKVIYGDLPTFCIGCLHQGHKVETCKIGNKRDAITSGKDCPRGVSDPGQKLKGVEIPGCNNLIPATLHIGDEHKKSAILDRVTVQDDSSEEEGEFIPLPKSRDITCAKATVEAQGKGFAADSGKDVVSVPKTGDQKVEGKGSTRPAVSLISEEHVSPIVPTDTTHDKSAPRTEFLGTDAETDMPGSAGKKEAATVSSVAFHNLGTGNNTVAHTLESNSAGTVTNPTEHRDEEVHLNSTAMPLLETSTAPGSIAKSKQKLQQLDSNIIGASTSEAKSCPPLIFKQNLEIFRETSKEISCIKKTRIVCKNHALEELGKWSYSEEEEEEEGGSTDQEFTLDPVMETIDEDNDDELRWSKLMGSKAQLIQRRSVSPVGRSSRKLTSLRKKIGLIELNKKAAILVVTEEYEKTQKIKDTRKTQQVEEEWTTPKRRGRHSKPREVPSKSSTKPPPPTDQARKRGRPKRK